ncbi:MAG: hypothetical protein GVY11_01820 [Gammaproteobacteria bacterium]|jgi:hypothetical protein|nr:hypothetical protein [Gammaproteobacteria bacterium]
MAISAKTRKLLWVRSGNECAFPGCSQLLTISDGNPDNVVLGEEAHIVAKVPGGPRGDAEVPGGYVDGVANLVLLYPTHHRLVDEQPNLYSVQAIREIKEAHERRVRQRAESEAVVRSLGEEEATGMCEGLRTFGAWRIGETLLVVCLMGSDPIRVSSNAWRGAGVILKTLNVRTGIKVLGEYSEADPDITFSFENDVLRVVEWSFDVDNGCFVPFVEHRHSLRRPDVPSTTVRLAKQEGEGDFTAADILEEYRRVVASGEDPEAVVLRFRKTGLANPTAVIEALTTLREEGNFDGALAEAASMVVSELHEYQDAEPLEE